MSGVVPFRDTAGTYRRVVRLMREWEPDPTADFPVGRDLARYLARELNDGDEVDPDHEVRAGGTGEAFAAVVDGDIAVTVHRDFGPGTVSEFSSLVGEIAGLCDYLVVYAHDLDVQDLDRWRMGKARYTAERSALVDVTYVHVSPGEEPATGGWPTALWHYAEPLVALLAVVIGVELAVVLQLQFGNLEPLLGPAATLVTSVVLMALLVLVYQRTEL